MKLREFDTEEAEIWVCNYYECEAMKGVGL